MLVTTKVKVNRFCSVLEMFTKVFSYQRAEAIAPRLLLPLRPCNVSPLAADSLGSWMRAILSVSGQTSSSTSEWLRFSMAPDRSGRRPKLVEQAGEPHELECRRRCGVGPQCVAVCPL